MTYRQRSRRRGCIQWPMCWDGSGWNNCPTPTFTWRVVVNVSDLTLAARIRRWTSPGRGEEAISDSCTGAYPSTIDLKGRRKLAVLWWLSLATGCTVIVAALSLWALAVQRRNSTVEAQLVGQWVTEYGHVFTLKRDGSLLCTSTSTPVRARGLWRVSGDVLWLYDLAAGDDFLSVAEWYWSPENGRRLINVSDTEMKFQIGGRVYTWSAGQ